MPAIYDFHDRVAVVTGGAQGIGLAIAGRLARDGATIWLWDRDIALAKTAAAQLSAVGKAMAVAVDVTNLAEVEAAARAAGARIDILVNNAGISGANMPTWEYPPEEWGRVLAVNLTGVFNCCRIVAPMMIAQNYGRIVNIASIAGKEGNPNAVAYSASKAGVIGLTKSLGKELAGYDIAVNCVTPAVAKTAIFDQMTEQHIAYMLSKIPRGRFVKVEEIADLVAFCASTECAFTTGAVFDISGGRATY
ncbi:MAG: SDR family oxidoreductase [Bradyrhizobiaceae bacterium]|nr:SDR family oxidoreductase [Bradyrhizobiaceae bacterium]